MQPERVQNEPERPRLYRLDPSLHTELTQASGRAIISRRLTPPEPYYPRFPERCGTVEPDAKFLTKDGNPYPTRVTLPTATVVMRGWLVPDLRSRLLPREVSHL